MAFKKLTAPCESTGLFRITLTEGRNKMRNKIKNYTSKVPPQNSAFSIREKLIQSGGVKSVIIERNCVYFVAENDGVDISYKLSVKIEQTRQILSRGRKPNDKTDHQADQTAWKILADHIEILLALRLQQNCSFLELFLPYAYDYHKNQTFFEKLAENRFKSLGVGSSPM